MVYLFKNGKAAPSRIKAGVRTDTEVQVIEGISAGDTVIVSAIIQLRPGIDVSIRNFR
jgi:membrane fusion protein (multidrug efflux system)